jgi:hypothetical protein
MIPPQNGFKMNHQALVKETDSHLNNYREKKDKRDNRLA